MKSKGFTLIELLAVIVIIAIIALVTIPLIGKVIENSKKGALNASASGIIEAAEIYYSTKMMENPETKTFTCSEEGCLSGEEKLDYKGQVTEGRVILYADGKVSICIEDGTNAALKLAEQSEITTEEGSCNYDSEDYSIDATVSKTKYDELQEELNATKEQLISTEEKLNNSVQEIENGKILIANSITNKGVATSETATFEEMSNNISSLTTGDIDKSALYEALQYSGLVTEDMSSEEMLTALEEEYPSTVPLYVNGVFNTELTSTGGNFIISGYTMSGNSMTYSRSQSGGYVNNWYHSGTNTSTMALINLGRFTKLTGTLSCIGTNYSTAAAGRVTLKVLKNGTLHSSVGPVTTSNSQYFELDISDFEDTDNITLQAYWQASEGTFTMTNTIANLTFVA